MAPEVEGLQLGHYQLTRRLGAGGMGEVYLARDLALKRDVAIKFVIADGTNDPSVARQLMHEAQAVAALDHPCICPVHDVGVDTTGRLYMVMQYVAGETLAARVARGPLQTREALDVCASIADALAAAHRHGIIHRDLKPHNIMLASSGGVKLLDFGIAKVLPGFATDDATSPTAASLSAAHVMLGTPAYMSPEQVQRRPIDGRSDLFSLGAILFETLTGERAFPGKSLAEVLGAVLHVQPPSPSSRRPDLDDRHDELVRRLLAKEPADRFRSADEVVGALRLLLPDTSRTTLNAVTPHPVHTPPLAWARAHRVPLLVAAAAIVTAAIAVPRYFRSTLPAMPADAQVWYDRGTEALRKGSFYTAAAAFEESVKLFPNHPFTYARLAETRTELDDESGAQEALISIGALVTNESRLPEDERLRLGAIRALVLRKVDEAAALYKRLADRHPSDPTAWVDLGRAQEAAADRAGARASYERAVALGPQYPAAFLRLGRIESNEGQRDKALAHFAESERLYRVAKDDEGQAEVLIWKAGLLNARGDYANARTELERALAFARAAESRSLLVRTQLRLCNVYVFEGQLARAEAIAASTVQAALDAGLQALAADGLVDLALVIQQRGQMREAEAQVRRALYLAERQHARRTEARARTQLASILYSAGQPGAALAALAASTDYLRQNAYRSQELTASNIAARALLQLDRTGEAREKLLDVLRIAQQIDDRRQQALALSGLYTAATNIGAFPEALALRAKAEAIHREQSDVIQLPYDLTSRAETLIDLGRFADAEAALRELDEGIARKIEPYVGRQQRALYLRGLAATLNRDYRAALQHLGTVESADPDTRGMGVRLREFVTARMRRAGAHGAQLPDTSITSTVPALRREMHYWLASTQLAAGLVAPALATAEAGLGLARTSGNDELEWRLAAIGSVAARALGRADTQRDLHARAAGALARVRQEWGDDAKTYDARPDLVELKNVAEL
jgi:tetratricopeptide (TPR) repeat protein